MYKGITEMIARLKQSVAVLAIWAIVIPVPVCAQGMSPAKVGEWIQLYYRSPKPEMIPEALQNMRKAGVLGRSNAQSGVIGFLSAVFEQNPQRIPLMLKDWNAFDDIEKATIARALWYASRPEATAFIAKIWSDRMRLLLQQDLTKAAPPASLETMDAREPGQLDFLWGRFFATGRPQPVLTIIRATKPRHRDGPTNGKTIDMASLIRSAAIWSLTSNAGRYDRVMAILQDAQKRSDATTAEVLRDIIDKAEHRGGNRS